MEKNADLENCCQCGREAPAANRPVCVTCKSDGRRSVFCRYGSDCLKAHGKAAHPGRNSWRVATEHVSIPGSKSGHDVLGGLVPVEKEMPRPLAPPMSAQPPSAEEQFVGLALGLVEEINSINARINEGNLTFDAAIAAIEAVLVKFPPELHRVAEAFRAGTVRAADKS